ncbi:DUF438 domain-containing protein [Thermospira aquatica]|uniref:DUF438 domain-containing protein n=1 Tax=Thermospira aquatica TaxID=2828656 RepID=A0AAX3BFP2_9SPIR|nr:DUF438 domain-containing protein [Thermospira aquatica]URA11212.1 DUF438 domain-containing protein [Thermospira aquatica]
MRGIELTPKQQETKEQIKIMMRGLKATTSQEELAKTKREFQTLLDQADPLVIAFAEQELASEGMSMEEFLQVCDIHLELFREKVQNPDLKVPDDHPIARFQQDHRIILQWMDKLRESIKEIANYDTWEEVKTKLPGVKDLLTKLMEAENHNIRQESALFPALEQKGIEKPPAIMWQEHTEMRQDKKALLKLFEQAEKVDFALWVNQMYQLSMRLYEKFLLHTQKEQNILYKVALEVLSQQDWINVKEATEEVGFFEISDRNV